MFLSNRKRVDLFMKLWIDDTRPAPEGYVWVHSVDEAKWIISHYSCVIYFNDSGIRVDEIEIIDIDHDAGIYAQFGGDYICLLDWLEKTGRNYPIRIHSANVVGVQNMLAICRRNEWTVVT